MSESSLKVSLSESSNSFPSLENIATSPDESGLNLSLLGNKIEVDELSNGFLHENASDPIPTPTQDNEELTGELQLLMKENSDHAEINTPCEDTAEKVEDSFQGIQINSEENFWLTKEWQSKERHIFILSSAGKPIYSRYGCEDKLATLFGVMQALVSFVQDTDEDIIQNIHAGDMCFSFMSKGYLIVVSAGKHRHSDQTLLQRQLVYIYNQIISTLTLSQLTKIFDAHRNFDLRRLLAGSERLVHTLVDFTENTVDFVLSSYRCLPLAAGTRDSISNVLSSACCKIKNLVFIILIGANRVITYLHMKKYNLRPMDIHLILNLVHSSESFKTAEIWTPLCLPQFDASGYLYSHVSYLADDCPACLLMLTVDKNLFFTLKEAKQSITEKLRCSKLLDEINSAISTPPLLTSSLNITHLRHFVYKCKQTSQLIVPPVEAPYVSSSHSHVPSSYSNSSSSNSSNPSHTAADDDVATTSAPSGSSSPYSVANSSSHPDTVAKCLLDYYSRLHCDIHRVSRPLKLYYQARDTETLLGWTTAGFELYLVFEPLISKPSATNAVNKLLRWIKKEEDKIFMLNNYTL